MIPTLYESFRHGSDGGSVYILSDLHFVDADCKFISPEYIKDIKARKKILILGNNDNGIVLGEEVSYAVRQQTVRIVGKIQEHICSIKNGILF